MLVDLPRPSLVHVPDPFHGLFLVYLAKHSLWCSHTCHIYFEEDPHSTYSFSDALNYIFTEVVIY